MAVAVVMNSRPHRRPDAATVGAIPPPTPPPVLAADRFVDGLPLVGGQHVSVIGNAASASTRVLRLVNLGVPGPSTSKDPPVRPRLASSELNGSDQQLLPRVRGCRPGTGAVTWPEGLLFCPARVVTGCVVEVRRTCRWRR